MSSNNHVVDAMDHHDDETTTSTAQSTTEMESVPQNGIDIRKALDILSARSHPPPSSSVDRRHLHATPGDFSSILGCPVCAGTKIPEEAKAMGQTILLHDEATTSGVSVSSNSTVAKDDDDLEEKRRALAEERSKRQEEILAQFQSMSVAELIQAVLGAQRERVATYREFDRGLDLVLQTGNMSEYPAVCARATASFAVLSDTITTIQSILLSRSQSKDLAQLIVKLQSQEREKLNLTAALHLERIRFESSANEPDDSIRNLFQEGMKSLQAKMSVCVEQINEILEEIRMEVMDDDNE